MMLTVQNLDGLIPQKADSLLRLIPNPRIRNAKIAKARDVRSAGPRCEARIVGLQRRLRITSFAGSIATSTHGASLIASEAVAKILSPPIKLPSPTGERPTFDITVSGWVTPIRYAPSMSGCWGVVRWRNSHDTAANFTNTPLPPVT
jgi:hypothetical protein